METGQGPMKVFIINQPVKNVIQAGNNLIVETEPAKDVFNYNNRQQIKQDENAIEKISDILKNNSKSIKFDDEDNESVDSSSSKKTKKKPVPANQKDEAYWERVRTTKILLLSFADLLVSVRVCKAKA